MPEPFTSIFPPLYPDVPADGPRPNGGEGAGADSSAIIPGLTPPLTPKEPAAEPVLEGQEAPPAEKVAVEDLGPQQPTPARRPRTAQERIAALVRQKHEAADENAALRAELAELRGLVGGFVTQRISAPSVLPAPAAAPKDPIGDLLLSGGAAPAPAPAAAPVPQTPLDIQAEINKAFEARDRQTRTQQAEVLRLRQAHERSFKTACEDLPALRKADSPARVLFNELFDNSPFRGHPDAPEHIALQVRGLLADEAATAQRTTRAKAQASVTPVASPTDEGPRDSKTIDAEIQKLYGLMRSGVSTGEEGGRLHARLSYLKTLRRQGQTNP